MHDPTPVHSDMEGIFGPGLASDGPRGVSAVTAWGGPPSDGIDMKAPGWLHRLAASTAGLVTIASALALAGVGIAIGLHGRLPAPSLRQSRQLTPARQAERGVPTRVAATSPGPRIDLSPAPVVPVVRHRETTAMRAAAPVHSAAAPDERRQADQAAAEKLRQEYADDAAITRRLNTAALQAMPER